MQSAKFSCVLKKFGTVLQAAVPVVSIFSTNLHRLFTALHPPWKHLKNSSTDRMFFKDNVHAMCAQTWRAIPPSALQRLLKLHHHDNGQHCRDPANIQAQARTSGLIGTLLAPTALWGGFLQMFRPGPIPRKHFPDVSASLLPKYRCLLILQICKHRTQATCSGSPHRGSSCGRCGDSACQGWSQ